MSFGTVVLSDEAFVLNETSIEINEIIPTHFLKVFSLISMKFHNVLATSHSLSFARISYY